MTTQNVVKVVFGVGTWDMSHHSGQVKEKNDMKSIINRSKNKIFFTRAPFAPQECNFFLLFNYKIFWGLYMANMAK